MNETKVETLIASLVETGLPELLQNDEICTAFKEGLKDAGCYPPSHIIVFALLRKVLVLGWGFGGEAIRSRLLQWLGKNEKLHGWLEKIAGFCKDHQDNNTLQNAMLEHLSRQPAVLGAMAPDAATDLDVVKQLYTANRFDSLEAGLDEITQLFQDFLTTSSKDPIGQHLGWDVGGDTTLADAIKHNSGKYTFVGREAETEMLRSFCGDISLGNRFSWLLMTGLGGEGKTRLAREFTMVSIDKNWRAGRLTIDDLKGFDHAGWLPAQPTFIVIDYPASAPDLVFALLQNFARRRAAFDWPVRVLLLERKTDGEWFKTVFPSTSAGAAIRPCVHRIGGQPLLDGLPLPPMQLGDVVTVMESRFTGGGVEPPDPALLTHAAVKTDPRYTEIDGKPVYFPRPLFAAAVAEVMFDAKKQGVNVDEGWIESLDREGILTEIIDRDRASHWNPAANGDAAILSAHENLVALATLAGGFPKSALRNLAQDLRELLPEARDTSPLAFNDNLVQTISSYSGGSALALEPDLLGEFFLLQKLARIEDSLGIEGRQAFCAAALAQGGDRAAESLLRTALDFPDRAAALGWLLPAPDSPVEALIPACGAVVDLVGRIGMTAQSTWPWIDAVANHETLDNKLALRLAMAAYNVAHDAGAARDWDRVDEMLAILSALRKAFPEDAAIALRQAKAAFNVTDDAGSAREWDRVSDMLAILSALRKVFPEDAAIALHQAMAAVNVTNQAGEAQEWDRVSDMLAILSALRKAFPEDAAIALHQAMAAVNVTNQAGEAQEWDRVDAMLAILTALRKVFPEDAAIALHQAMAAVNVTNQAGEAQEWDRVDAMLAIGRELADHPEKADLIGPLLRLWRIVLRQHLNPAERDVTPDPAIVSELASLTIFASENLSKEIEGDWVRALIIIKHCHANGFAEQTQTCIDTLAENGLDWSQVPPLEF